MIQAIFTQPNLALPEKLAYSSFFDPPNFVERVTVVAISEKCQFFAIFMRPEFFL